MFFRSVSFTELESLVDYIYKGRTQVAGSSVQSFLSLATSLGVSGFSEESYKENIELSSGSVTHSEPTSPTTPLSKESPMVLWSSVLFNGSYQTSNTRPCSDDTVQKSCSVPASLDESEQSGSASKKRKLFSQSLDETVRPGEAGREQPLYCNLQPLYSNLPPPSYS